MKNAMTNTRIEFHIIQSFPVTCLNRDDVGAPKTAIIGGSTRARVSSQCWKRQVRLAMQDFSVTLGKRTKLIEQWVAKECELLGATPEQAKACGQTIEQVFIKPKKEKKPAKKAEVSEEEASTEDADKGNDTLIFLSPKEVQIIAQCFKDLDFNVTNFFKKKDQKDQAKELVDMIQSYGKDKSILSMDALDIALFGRMVAKAADMNVEAACSFSHAISTHAVSNEVEFFTALDDLQTEPGSAHIGSLEFNSATYYRYISLDLGQLTQTMGDEADLKAAIEAFTKALFMAVPSARQTTQSGASPWEFARVLVRKGQRLQVPFETAVKRKEGGFSEASIETMTSYLDTKQKQFGSMFGQLGCYEWGRDADYSIDDLVSDLQSHVSSVQ